MNISHILSMVIAITCMTFPSYADMYKFVDSKGTVHFTNMPQGKGYKKILSSKSTSAETDYDHIIRDKSVKYEIEPSVIKALIRAESGWNPKAVSKKGAVGLMQLMPSTASDMNIDNPYDPEENIEGGTRYLRMMLDRFNDDLNLALAAYNAGPATVEKTGNIPSFPETRQFVKKVLTKSRDRVKPVYTLTHKDGTILYTNTPELYKNSKLSKF
ncbi:MAG: lytic transglycosylase domain-containing protein [Nitrospiraceae bacterium]|nr:MAG: lytic transglycosylase domain-containing protein [Nitrospiraceae bacterium]